MSGSDRLRRILEPPSAVDQAADVIRAAFGDDVEEIDDTPPRAPVADCFIDWNAFFARDRNEPEWLLDDIIARARGHSIYAARKTGKSLFLLWCACQLIRSGVVVAYLDYEMSEADLFERLDAMGLGAHSDLQLLHYALLPSLPPLDTRQGADALLAILDGLRAAHPDQQIALVLDTTARAVAGEENSADTFRAFYSHTGLALKQRNITWIRLDHSGKDATRGARGSSAKGDDVDLVWRLERAQDGIVLRREAARMGWVPERVDFHQLDEPLRFVRVEQTWPAGTKEAAAWLDRLGVAPTIGERRAGEALRDAGWKGRATIVRAAQKWRRQAAEGAPE